jgi:hypothetical protein
MPSVVSMAVEGESAGMDMAVGEDMDMDMDMGMTVITADGMAVN